MSLAARLRTVEPEWSLEEIYLGMPRPGSAMPWLRIDRKAEPWSSKTAMRWIAYFNDLHKGRNTGSAMAWFLDVFSLACIVFYIDGLAILALHAARAAPDLRQLTGLGLLRSAAVDDVVLSLILMVPIFYSERFSCVSFATGVGPVFAAGFCRADGIWR